MKRSVLIIAILSATLVFLIKLFETRFLSGQLSMKVYITVIGVIFLAVGIWLGFRLTRHRSTPSVESFPNTILTNRETELLTLLAQGLSNKEIAEKAFVSENTVKKHLNNVYAKLDVTRRVQAVTKAKQLGILQ